MAKFRLPIHIVCGKDDLITKFHDVYFENGFMYATDSEIVVKASIKHYSNLSENEMRILEGKRIPAQVFDKIYKSKTSDLLVYITEEGVEEKGILYRYSRNADKSPRFDKLFEAFNDKPITDNSIKRIGINPAHLDRLSKSLKQKGDPSNHFHLYFNGETKSVKVLNSYHDEKQLVGLIAPVAIND